MKFYKKSISALFLSFVFLLPSLNAQYFGKNKPRYHNFDFEILESENFDVHHYCSNHQHISKTTKSLENWYKIHQETLQDTFGQRNPIIFYNDHADFQQTNTIGGSIGVGTGGVTEGLKNRVVLPFTFTNEQTDHVIGHELVHAFQYHLVINGDSTSLKSLGNIPLWMVEGLAEYMSIGRTDAHTAMWMRDAVLQDKIPELKEMSNPEYFPYRYGQAFWSFVTGVYGDNIIRPLFENTAKYGLERAVLKTLNLSLDNLSSQWVNGLKTYYKEHLRDQKESSYGKGLLTDENSGDINVSPSLSPNGKYLVFLSERDLFSTDLFLADAREGKVIRKIQSSSKDGHLDAINSLESAGTWSPNSKEFAFIAFKEGKNIMIIKEVETGNTLQEFYINNIPAFTNPAWSPSGKEIIFSGLVQGQTDLYAVNVKTKKVRQLTDDPYSEIHASFNADGSKLVFATDEKSYINKGNNGRYTFDLAVMDFETTEKEILNLFHGADNLNPVFDPEENLYFISNQDGYRNMYWYNPNRKEVFAMTDFLVGVSGITKYSPAIASSTKKDRILYTKYFDGKYSIIRAKKENLLNKLVNTQLVNHDAAILPVIGLSAVDLVNKNLIEKYKAADEIDTQSFKTKKYKSKLELDYVTGGTGVAIGGSTNYGNYTGLQGGIGMLFGDMLGNNQIFTQLALNGEFIDAGGQVAYLNRKNRLAWGISGSHLPLKSGYAGAAERTTINLGGRNIEAIRQELNIIRVFNEEANVFAHYPFSKTLRVEGSVGGFFRSFRWDQYDNYYQQVGVNDYNQIAQERERIPVPDELQLDQYYTLIKGFGGSAGVALVGDNSFFGLTAPLSGHRFRLGIDKYVGSDNYTSIVADYRKYIRLKPITLAFRGMGFLRFENEVNSVYPFYVGSMGYVRGYGDILRGSNIISELGLDFGELLGSKLGLFNFEVRLPFTGPKKLALIKSKFLLSDLNLFFDAGIAFDDFSHFREGELLQVGSRDDMGNLIFDNNGNLVTELQNRKPPIISSAGVSMRINVLGALIVEPYLAWQLRKNNKATWGVNIIPGW